MNFNGPNALAFPPPIIMVHFWPEHVRSALSFSHSVESTKGPLPLKAILIPMSVPFLYEGGVPSARIKSGIVFGLGL